MARLFFENYEKVAEILRVPVFLVKDLGMIWETLVQSSAIDSEKFGHMCDLFVQKFNLDTSINWYQFSPTVGSFYISDSAQITSHSYQIF